MKPRNHVVVAMIKSNKGSQVHGKSKKALRREAKITLNKDQRGNQNDGK